MKNMRHPSRISLIVAMARNQVIGDGGKMPWHLSEDLRRFRRITWGKPVLMGRYTYEAIGRPLPGRHNIVLTRSAHFRPEGCTIVHSLEAGLALAGNVEGMIIGGATLYEAALPLASRMYLTVIDADYPGDTFFPRWDRGEWREVTREERPPAPDFPHTYRFMVLERR